MLMLKMKSNEAKKKNRFDMFPEIQYMLIYLSKIKIK